MNGWLALVASVLLLAGNGFFVAAEFALVASKRHRLQEAAAGGDRRAGAALAATRQLSLTLAGAQLGVTLCSLGLGALAEPALAHLLEPVLHALRLPDAAIHAVAFVVALAVVVFLHMVVGEMAPKSWAIADPERSALRLARSFHGFTRLTGPLLAALNWMANAVVRAGGVEPRDELAQSHGPEELRVLLEQSQEHGLLPSDQHDLLASMLQLQRTTVRRVMTPWAGVTVVPAGATADEVERASRAAGRSRLPVVDDRGRVTGVLHVREALRANAEGRPARAGDLAAAPFVLAAAATVLDAVQAMRDQRAQIALVTGTGNDAGNGNGTAGPATVGLVALEDLLEIVIGEFDDETDPVRP